MMRSDKFNHQATSLFKDLRHEILREKVGIPCQTDLHPSIPELFSRELFKLLEKPLRDKVRFQCKLVPRFNPRLHSITKNIANSRGNARRNTLRDMLRRVIL